MVYLGCYTTSVQLHKETSHNSSTTGDKTEAPFPETTKSGKISPPQLKLLESLLLPLLKRYHENLSTDYFTKTLTKKLSLLNEGH